MSTRRPAEDASLWSTGDGELTAAAAPPYHQQNDQIALSRPRLRWSKELHEKFISAVNELGGASKATPKTIWSLMQEEEVTLLHIKSHLQKYRQGKISRRFLTRDAVPFDGQKIENEMPEDESMDMDDHQGPSNTSDAFDMDAQKYENLDHLVEPQTSEMTTNPPSFNLEKSIAGNENPPLFPSIPASSNLDFPEWSELLDEDDMKPIVPHLNSLGYPSELLPFARTHNSSRPSTMFGSFFDEVERFPRIEDSLMVDDDVYPCRGI